MIRIICWTALFPKCLGTKKEHADLQGGKGLGYKLAYPADCPTLWALMSHGGPIWPFSRLSEVCLRSASRHPAHSCKGGGILRNESDLWDIVSRSCPRSLCASEREGIARGFFLMATKSPLHTLLSLLILLVLCSSLRNTSRHHASAPLLCFRRRTMINDTTRY